MCGSCRKHGGKRQLERLARVLGINIKIDDIYVVKVCVGSVGIGECPVSVIFLLTKRTCIFTDSDCLEISGVK